EVYSSVKQHSPRRTLAATVFVLLSVSALALDMSLRRSARPLSGRVQPPGWTISFEFPKGWLRGLIANRGPVTVIAFSQPEGTRHSATIVFWRLMHWDDNDPDAIASNLLREHGGGEPQASGGVGARKSDTKLGAGEACERVDAQHSTVVRAALFSAGDAYAVSLNVDNGVIGEHLYNLFDLSCRSIRIEGR
ncbi:MAG: hypothetical protein ACE5HE_10165, partial [Phycisphaerae bacterium]